MKTILNTARLYIYLTVQQSETWILLLVVPVIMMVVLGLAINQDAFADVTILVDVVDEDQTELSAALLAQLEGVQGDTVVFCWYGADDNDDACNLKAKDSFSKVGTDRLKEGDVAATLIIPQGFGAAIEQGQAIPLTYRSNDQFNSPTVAKTTIETAISQFSGSILIADIGTRVGAEDFNAYPTDEERQAAYESLRTNAQNQMLQPAVTVKRQSSGEAIVVGLGTRQSVSGIGSMFVLFTLLGVAQTMVVERQQGTLQRLFTLPVPRFNIITGKILGAFSFGVLQFVVFILIGLLFLDVDWGKDYLAVAALVLAYCWSGTALGFAMSTFVKTPEQAAGASNFLAMMLAPLGGAWWPLDIVPDFMRVAGHISPIAWVMDGFNELLYYNGTLVDVLPMVGVLLGMSVLFIGVAVQRFKYE
ncbi:MAG: ABC transporter permease [Anaerolineales bacterium]|nr:ABC transporter permease [Anaerolineales bacterium]